MSDSFSPLLLTREQLCDAIYTDDLEGISRSAIRGERGLWRGVVEQPPVPSDRAFALKVLAELDALESYAFKRDRSYFG